MNIVFDPEDTEFLTIETKWGKIIIEQSMYATVVKLETNTENNSSHIENYFGGCVGMESDNKPED